jgi:hypothetical protein
MAELLVMVEDRVTGDPYKDAGNIKKGHVIVVCPDGWTWSKEERQHARWRILSLPGVPESAFDALMRSESDQRKIDDPNDLDADPQRNRMLQRRAYKIAAENLTPAQRNAVMEYPRKNEGILTVPRAMVDNVTQRLAATPDPGVVG